MKLVLAENMMKSIVEVSRVFGNLTREKQVRDHLHQQQGLYNLLWKSGCKSGIICYDFILFDCITIL